VRSNDGAACALWLAGRPEVREVLPRAGHHRIRLQPGLDPQGWVGPATGAARASGLALAVEPHPRVELEDVVVALLEERA
jgi:hypothetical protein